MSHFRVSKTSDVLQSATYRSQPEQNEVINTGNSVTTTHNPLGTQFIIFVSANNNHHKTSVNISPLRYFNGNTFNDSTELS